MNKQTREIELLCQRCGSLSANIKEYLKHKKDIHRVRITDSIASLRQIGIEDPCFKTLLEENPKEKLHPDYVKESRKILETYMREHNR